MASDAPDEVNVRWRSLMALDLPPAPANLRRNPYINKAQFMEDLATRYNGFADSEETKFGAYQLALFSIASSATIEAVQNDDDKLRDVGGCAKDIVKFFVNGSYRLQVAKTVDPSEQPSAQGDTLSVEERTAVEPTASSFVTRAIGSVRQFARHRMSSSRKPPEQPAASSEPAPDPQSSTRRGLRSLKRKRSHSNTTQPTVSDTGSSTVPDTGSSVVNRPKAARPRRSPPTARNQGVVKVVKVRDSDMCILTKSKCGIEAAHILPHAINSTSEGINFFRDMIPVLTAMFGNSFTQRLERLVGSPSSSDKEWNMLTLNVYLHQLYDRGHVGFRPVKITANDICDPDRWRVYFTVHWLGKTKTRQATPYTSGASALQSMLELREDYSANRARYSIFDADTGTRIADGTEYFVEMCALDDAKKMYDCLGLSWATRTILFMAGGAGTPDADPRSDEYYDPEIDIVHPDQDKMDQKIYEEYLQRQFKEGIMDPNF
ncbi:hypothetical protein MY10362_005690 [Beauveria mimosiformis]